MSMVVTQEEILEEGGEKNEHKLVDDKLVFKCERRILSSTTHETNPNSPILAPLSMTVFNFQGYFEFFRETSNTYLKKLGRKTLKIILIFTRNPYLVAEWLKWLLHSLIYGSC